VSAFPSRPIEPSLYGSADGGAVGFPALDVLEAQYSAATLALWNARSRYLDLHERAGGHLERLHQAWHAYEAARILCTRLSLLIEAIEDRAVASSCARAAAGFTAPPSDHNAQR